MNASNQQHFLNQRRNLWWLVLSALITVILWQFSWGHYALYPFTILSTWFHEMGHGLTALILGADFEKLVIYSNGSGVATHRGSVAFGAFGHALVSAGGPLGPPFAGAFFILAGRYRTHARIALTVLAVCLIVSVLIWVRSGFGIVFISILGTLLLLIAIKSPAWLQSFIIQFLGIQACISSYRQLNYLFTHSVTIGGNKMLSDTAQMGEKLFLPYWFWGGCIVLISFLLLLWSLTKAYK